MFSGEMNSIVERLCNNVGNVNVQVQITIKCHFEYYEVHLFSRHLFYK